jgi:hypothetical protein
LWEITVPENNLLVYYWFNPTFNRSIINNGILVNASEDWKPLQLLLLMKAFDRLFTPEEYFISLAIYAVKTRLILMLY